MDYAHVLATEPCQRKSYYFRVKEPESMALAVCLNVSKCFTVSPILPCPMQKSKQYSKHTVHQQQILFRLDI